MFSLFDELVVARPFIYISSRSYSLLSYPYEQRDGKQKDRKANDSQEDVDILQAHCFNPWSGREEHNSKQVSHEDDANQDVAEDL